jgi:hypothetical protein
MADEQAERPYDEDFPEAALGDVVRLKEPYLKLVNRKRIEYRYGIVAGRQRRR